MKKIKTHITDHTLINNYNSYIQYIQYNVITCQV